MKAVPLIWNGFFFIRIITDECGSLVLPRRVELNHQIYSGSGAGFNGKGLLLLGFLLVFFLFPVVGVLLGCLVFIHWLDPVSMAALRYLCYCHGLFSRRMGDLYYSVERWRTHRRG